MRTATVILGALTALTCITPPRDGHVWGVTERAKRELGTSAQLVCDWDPRLKLLDCETMTEYVERKRWEALTGERIPMGR